MRKIIILLATVSLMACNETWQGVKKDSKEVARSVGDAGNQLADKVKGSLNSDKEKEDRK
ncbi:MAG: hypothetical protein OEY66_10340 [Gammaproteobacteria bacterium]|nr:hypothetical protein [Gammaproteobacteria bacterium]